MHLTKTMTRIRVVKRKEYSNEKDSSDLHESAKIIVKWGNAVKVKY